jgi:hypothetical protein
VSHRCADRATLFQHHRSLLLLAVFFNRAKHPNFTIAARRLHVNPVVGTAN